MNVAPNPSSDPASILSNTYPLQWEGDMWDGDGATFGPPRAVLSANADEIWLKGRRGDFHLPRNAVVRIGRGRFYPWLFQGVRIRHNMAGYPSDLQFRPMDGGARDILVQLKSLGFPTG